MNRPVVLPWSCQHSGDCCTKTEGITVTTEERDLLLAINPSVRFVPDGDYWFLVGRPCPFFDGRCTVYHVRPYNCRRWHCFRPDPTTEPFDDGNCFWDRFRQSRAVRRLAVLWQRKAQRWARAHGWKHD